MKSLPISTVGTPKSVTSEKLVDGVLSIKGPFGQSLLQLVLSGDMNCAALDLMVGRRLYTIDIRPKPGARITHPDVKSGQERAMAQRAKEAFAPLYLSKILSPPGALQSSESTVSPSWEPT